MSGIAGGADAAELAERMGHREVALLDGPTDFVADASIYDGSDLRALLESRGTGSLEAVNGDYAFAWRDEDDIVLGRDVLGVRPLFYATEPFAFTSERQALEKEGFEARELHPRQFLRYDTSTGGVRFEERGFFGIDVDETEVEAAAEAVETLVLEAVDRRVDRPAALLFSGGLDSSVLASALQQLGKEFTCYTAGIQPGNADAPRDVESARVVAGELGLELEVAEASMEEVEEALLLLADRLSTTSPVKLGVALPAHVALQDAGEDVVLTGLGAEQLYAGYSRQREDELNRECLSGLRGLFHRDLYRDNVTAALGGREACFPFLDHDLIDHMLTLPGEHKVRDGYRKYVLRLAAENLGVPDTASWRKKTAAQYGSNFDKALQRLAKKNGYENKQGYCNSFREEPEHVIGALFSGGKDSNAALYRMQRRNCEVACLINLRSANPDSYMFDTKNENEVREQAERLGIPILFQETAGEKEAELEDLETALERAREDHGIDGVVAGALKSMYQKERVEEAAEKAGLKSFAPLWNEDQENYMRWLLREGFRVKITEVAAQGLDERWVGTVLDEENLEELLELAEEHRFNAAGEGGEYETVVVDAPTFH